MAAHSNKSESVKQRMPYFYQNTLSQPTSLTFDRLRLNKTHIK